jgi:ferredoxin-NADP reductase
MVLYLYDQFLFKRSRGGVMSQKLRCQVTDILDHGEHVYSIFLKPENLAPRFQPGQFLQLALDKYSPGDYWPDSHSFSIASTPTDRHLLRITYAVKGLFTQRMESELHPGSHVWVKLPYGEFIINNGEDVCLLAGGTGMTAFTAFLGGLTPEYPRSVDIFYGARCPQLLIFRSLVEAARQRCPNLKGWFFAEQDAEGTDCFSGRIDAVKVINLVAAPLPRTFYLAGPPEMIADLTIELNKFGVSPDRLIADAW